MRQPLAGRRILVTRPLAQAGPLVTAIEQQGGQGVVFPLIDIAPADDQVPLAKALGHFCTFDFAVFISANAVEYSVPHLLAWADWPATVRAVAVGPGTAAPLAAHRVRDVLVPSAGFDSEAVLALPELAPEQVGGKRVLLLRGNGGRPLLADALRERGAQVTCVSCYQRRMPVDASPLLNLLSADGGDALDAVTLSSSEGVRNLLALLTPSALECLRRLPCFVPHRRIAEVVAEAGLRAILTEPADQGIIDGLCRYGWSDSSERSLNLNSKEKA